MKRGRENKPTYRSDKNNFFIARTSTTNGKSIEDQLKECKDKFGFDENSEEIRFNGSSAYNESSYTIFMLDILKNTTIKKFYFYCVDRFSRNCVNSHIWLRLIRNNNHKIFFLVEDISYPPIDNFTRLNTILGDAETESRQKSVRAIRTHIRNNDKFIGIIPGFGSNFNKNRIWEIKLLLFIDKLLNLENSEPLHINEIKFSLNEIINLHPNLDNNLKIYIKKQIDCFEIEKDEIIYLQLEDKQTYTEIAQLLNDLLITELIKQNGYFKIEKLENEPKLRSNIYTSFFVINEPSYDDDYTLSSTGQREITIKNIYTMLLNINKEKDCSNILSEDILIDLNKNIIGLKKTSYLRRKTKIKVPHDLIIPENFRDYLFHKIIYMKDLMSNFYENLKNEWYFKQIQNMKSIHYEIPLHQLAISEPENIATGSGIKHSEIFIDNSTQEVSPKRQKINDLKFYIETLKSYGSLDTPEAKKAIDELGTLIM